MKKAIVLLFALAMCMALTFPVFAAQDDFVPSITYKGEPEIVPVEDENGEPAIGVVYQGTEIISYIYEGCLVVTPVAKVDSSKEIPEDAAETLKYVYQALVNGDMKLPYDKVSGYAGQEMVVLELVDISWLCGTETSDHDHPTQVAPTGVVFDLTFDLGVSEFSDVIVMTYNDDVWNPIVKTVNNGDGTVTCTFEHLCPVAISVSSNYSENPPQTGDQTNVWIWFAVMLAAAVGIVVVVVMLLRKKKK